MGFRFKIGDKVRVKADCYAVALNPQLANAEGIVTQLGGIFPSNSGAVVTGEVFPMGDKSYGEHGHYFPDDWLELIENKKEETCQ